MSIDLDGSQREAVEIDSRDRQIVIAGPGSGKTEVVAALVEHLIEDEGLEVRDELLIISFSNAAVHAVSGRLAAKGIEPITVQTMDSLAAEILRDLADDEYAGQTFDQRVIAATKLLRDDAWDKLESLEHLVVDEVQDVVGVRADFLLELIRSLDDGAGFTLLGDPAQGIYDFQLNKISSTTSDAFVAAAAEAGDVETKHLTGQYRARTRDARAAALLRNAVLADDLLEVDEFEADLVPVGAIADAVEHAVRWSGTTAFLTSTNGQAMLAARKIADTGAFAELRRRAEQKVLAPWLGAVFTDWSALAISRDEFGERLAERSPDLDPAATWHALRSVTGTKGSELDLTRLVPRLRGHRPLQPELLHQQNSGLVISTVHRAKGLEFDNVVLVDFPVATWNRREESPSALTRRKFVALTRAMGQIVRADGPKDWSMHRCPDGRWYRGGREKFQTFGFELRVDDLDRAQPHGNDPALVQEYLRTSVGPGDPLSLRLDVRRSDLRLPVYAITHGEMEVARTSEEFGHRLVQRIKSAVGRKGRPWPGLSGLRADGIRTVAGDPADGPVGRRGLWLGISAAGMLDLDWKDDRA